MDNTERMQIIANNITKYRLEKGISQKELAEQIGITPSTMTDYMKLRSAPSFGVIQKIADYFGVLKSDIDSTFKETALSTAPTTSPTINTDILELNKNLNLDNHKKWVHYGNELLDKQKEEEEEEQQQSQTKETPAVYYTYDFYPQPASAGTGQYLGDTPVEQINLPVDVKADFVIPITGDSMEPEYHDGDYVFIKSTVTLNDGEIGVFEFYGDSYIKQLLITPNGAFLHSLNDKYDDIPVDADSDFRIIGKVVEKYQN